MKMRSEAAELRRRNDCRREKAHEDDLSLMRRIGGKLSIPQISEFEQEVVAQELLDMAEEARARGGTLAEELGVPAEDFCRGVLENCQHTGWGERLLGALLRLLGIGAFLFLLAPIHWLMNYENLLLFEELTHTNLGLQGKWIMLLPVQLPAALLGLFLLVELWNQFIDHRLFLHRGGRAVSIVYYLAVCGVWLFLLPEIGDGTPLGGDNLLRMDMRVVVPAYLLILLLAWALYRLRIHRIAKDYHWQRDE